MLEYHLTYPFNTRGTGWMYYPERGKMDMNWEGGNILKSVEYANKLYTDGILDPEFITENTDGWVSKINNGNMFTFAASNRVGGPIQSSRFWANGNLDARVAEMPIFMADGVGVDAFYAVPSILGGYGFGVSARTNEADAVWRFLEALYDDEVKDLSTYGREGIDFEIIGDAKIPLPNDDGSAEWRGLYSYAFTGYPSGMFEARMASSIFGFDGLTQEIKLEFYNKSIDIERKIANQILFKRDYSPAQFLPILPENLDNQRSEANAEMESLYLKAVIGEISLEEFAAEKDRMVAVNQNITDWYNAEIEIIKAERDLTFTR